jgi:hypothetical protein
MAESINQQLHIPPEFSGPAQLILYTRYGDPRESGWENKWMTVYPVQETFPWFPNKRIYLHKHFWPLLQQAFKDLMQRGLHHEIKTFDDGYHLRNIRGSSCVLSVHSWGAAIDLNSRENPMGSNGLWSPGFIEIMTANQIFCGQNWSARKDPMHFALVDG